MPELPEVETVVRTLLSLVKGKKIKDVKIFANKLIKEPDVLNFKKEIKNQKINNISRIGKHIIFELDKHVLISHLRMEGKYYYQTSNSNDNIDHKHMMASIIFEDKNYLIYYDTRKFGTFHLQSIDNYKNLNPIAKVGPEPWDKKCSVNYLAQKFSKKTIAIKSTLLDQTIMAGLGNIYVNEVLHLARIDPNKPTKFITKEQIKKIIHLSKKIMRESIKLGGSSISSYTSSLGVSGKFQNKLVVHTKKGEMCSLCKNAPILKKKINGRGTYYCRVCQK